MSDFDARTLPEDFRLALLFGWDAVGAIQHTGIGVWDSGCCPIIILQAACQHLGDPTILSRMRRHTPTLLTRQTVVLRGEACLQVDRETIHAIRPGTTEAMRTRFPKRAAKNIVSWWVKGAERFFFPHLAWSTNDYSDDPVIRRYIDSIRRLERAGYQLNFLGEAVTPPSQPRHGGAWDSQRPGPGPRVASVNLGPAISTGGRAYVSAGLKAERRPVTRRRKRTATPTTPTTAPGQPKTPTAPAKACVDLGPREQAAIALHHDLEMHTGSPGRWVDGTPSAEVLMQIYGSPNNARNYRTKMLRGGWFEEDVIHAKRKRWRLSEKARATLGVYAA